MHLQPVIVAQGGVTKYKLTGFPNLCTGPFSLFYYYENIKNKIKSNLVLKFEELCHV